MNETRTGCDDCDFDALDQLVCRAQRVAKLSEVTAEAVEHLKDRQTTFEAAQKTYLAARAKARPQVIIARDRLAVLRKDVGCRLSRDRGCLERQWQRIATEIAECRGPLGCPVVEHEFTDAVEAPDGAAGAPAHAGKAQEYRAVAIRLGELFDQAVTEVTALPTRVGELTAEVEKLVTESAVDADRATTVRLYARILVAQWSAQDDNVWNGYASAREFVNCLCSLLMQLRVAWECVAALEAEAAMRTCCEAQRKKRCDDLAATRVDTLIEEFDEHCADTCRCGGGMGDGEDEEGPGGEDDSDTGQDDPTDEDDTYHGRACTCGCHDPARRP